MTVSFSCQVIGDTGECITEYYKTLIQTRVSVAR